MKTSKRITGLLLALLVSGYLAVRWEAQLQHSLEEACYHSRLSSAADSESDGNTQPGIRSGPGQLEGGIHICHSCLLCSSRATVAFEPAREWNARLVTECSLDPFQRPAFISRQIDCPNRRAPPASLLS